MKHYLSKIAKKILYPFHYLSWIYKYAKFISGLNLLKEIKIVSIEFSSVCNLRCKYCFLEQVDRSRFLDIKIYEKLIKEFCENPRYRINVMEWPISGEFFVYPQYREVVEITRRYMDEFPHFKPHIILNTNVVLLNEERIDLILNSGVISQIICSIDGHDSESFEKMRPPAKFPALKKNMQLLIQKNKKLEKPVFIQINNGRNEDSVGQEFSDEMKEILRMAARVTQWRPQYWNASFNKPQKKFYPAQSFCTFVFNSVTLASSGKISKCCMDLKGETVYADLAQNSLEEIWHSQIRKGFLTLMFKNKRKDLKGCGQCSITCTDNDNRFNNPIRQFKEKALSLVKGKEYFLKPLDSIS